MFTGEKFLFVSFRKGSLGGGGKSIDDCVSACGGGEEGVVFKKMLGGTRKLQSHLRVFPVRQNRQSLVSTVGVRYGFPKDLELLEGSLDLEGCWRQVLPYHMLNERRFLIDGCVRKSYPHGLQPCLIKELTKQAKK